MLKNCILWYVILEIVNKFIFIIVKVDVKYIFYKLIWKINNFQIYLTNIFFYRLVWKLILDHELFYVKYLFLFIFIE